MKEIWRLCLSLFPDVELMLPNERQAVESSFAGASDHQCRVCVSSLNLINKALEMQRQAKINDKNRRHRNVGFIVNFCLSSSLNRLLNLTFVLVD